MNEPRLRPAPRVDDEPTSTLRRLKVLVLTTQALTEMLHGNKRPRVPRDAIVLKDLSNMSTGMEARWLIYSGGFDCLEAGQPVPAFYPAMETVK